MQERLSLTLNHAIFSRLKTEPTRCPRRLAIICYIYKTYSKSEAQHLHGRFQIHKVVRFGRLLSPDDGASAIDGKQTSLLPLVPHDSTGTAVTLLQRGRCRRRRRPSSALLARGRLGAGSEAAVPLDGAGDLFAQPALLLPALHLRRRVEHGPDAAEAQPPRRVRGAVLIDDNLDVPGPAQQVQPLARGLLGRVRDGDAGQRALVAVGYGAEGEEGLLRDCVGKAVSVQAGQYSFRNGGNERTWAG